MVKNVFYFGHQHGHRLYLVTNLLGIDLPMTVNDCRNDASIFNGIPQAFLKTTMPFFCCKNQNMVVRATPKVHVLNDTQMLLDASL